MRNKNKGQVVLIIILIITVFVLCGYIFYTDYYKKGDNTIAHIKIVKSNTKVTNQIASGLARQTYYDYNNIWTKYNSVLTDDKNHKQLTNYNVIMDKYYTKKGISDFEYVNSNIITKEGTNVYLIINNQTTNCNIYNMEFTINSFNKNTIEYKVTEKKYCTNEKQNKISGVKTSISEIKIVNKNNTWKIDELTVGSNK